MGRRPGGTAAALPAERQAARQPAAKRRVWPTALGALYLIAANPQSVCPRKYADLAARRSVHPVECSGPSCASNRCPCSLSEAQNFQPASCCARQYTSSISACMWCPNRPRSAARVRCRSAQRRARRTPPQSHSSCHIRTSRFGPAPLRLPMTAVCLATGWFRCRTGRQYRRRCGICSGNAKCHALASGLVEDGHPHHNACTLKRTLQAVLGQSAIAAASIWADSMCCRSMRSEVRWLSCLCHSRPTARTRPLQGLLQRQLRVPRAPAARSRHRAARRLLRPRRLPARRRWRAAGRQLRVRRRVGRRGVQHGRRAAQQRRPGGRYRRHRLLDLLRVPGAASNLVTLTRQASVVVGRPLLYM